MPIGSRTIWNKPHSRRASLINVRCLNASGLAFFRQWLDAGATGDVPESLLFDAKYSASITERVLDREKRFTSRFNLGSYLKESLSGLDFEELLREPFDGMWAWIGALYFGQLTAKGVRRYEHYIPTRRGTAGSLLHRNAPRTAFELVSVHGTNARFALQQKVHTHGQLLESLSASRGVVRNTGFFGAAAKVYLDSEGKLRRGATSKSKKPRERRMGDESGKGSIRRLPVALKRLDLTFDVEIMSPDELIARLPREFARWRR